MRPEDDQSATTPTTPAFRPDITPPQSTPSAEQMPPVEGTIAAEPVAPDTTTTVGAVSEPAMPAPSAGSMEPQPAVPDPSPATVTEPAVTTDTNESAQPSAPAPAPVIAETQTVAAAAEPMAADSPTATPAMVSGPVVGGNDSTPVSGGMPAKHRLPKLVLPLIAALVVLSAGTAAAYYMVYKPNQPAMLLRTALDNTLQQHQVSADISFSGSPTQAGSGVAFKIDAKTSTNSDAKTADAVINATVSGVTIPLEARLVNQNAYVKVGDLSGVESLASGFAPTLAPTVKSIAGSITNKWVEFDSTLLSQAGASCALNASWAVSKSDIALLNDAYLKNSFVTIKSTASDTVNGQPAEKMVLSINDNKAAAYAKSLSNLSMVQSLQKCGGGSAKPLNTSSLADGDTTPLTVWVDKASKRLVKLDMQSTAQDAQKAHLQGELTATFSYGNVQISAPQGAIPALQLLSQIEAANPMLTSALNGSATTP